MLARELAITSSDALRLISLGSVYHDFGRLPADREIGAGEWLRVHARPRRYVLPIPDWRARIVEETESYVVVDKPAGLPVHPTCDNGRENLLTHLQTVLGRPLFVCHRLDIGTSGLIVLAKDLAFRTRFGGWLESRKLEKTYLAWTATPVELGTKIHYQANDARGARRVSPTPIDDWKYCELEVLGCVPKIEREVYEITVRLITGRMHQIRCQLAALGAPIVGDTTYGSQQAYPEGPDGSFALRCVSLRFPTGELFQVAF